MKGAYEFGEAINHFWSKNVYINSNNTVTAFSRKKRLALNTSKCVQLAVNINKSDLPPNLIIDDEEIECVTSAKCLGDIFTGSGSNNKLVSDRVNRGKGIIVTATSLCNDITLGQHYIRSALVMYQCVFLKSLLFNSQSWSNITQTHMKDLQTIQLKFLKRMMQAPNSTPNCFVFLELGLLPIQYEIHKCQLSFLHHVLHLQPTKPVSQIYHQQLNFSHEPNWGNSVENLLKHMIYALQTFST